MSQPLKPLAKPTPRERAGAAPLWERETFKYAWLWNSGKQTGRPVEGRRDNGSQINEYGCGMAETSGSPLAHSLARSLAISLASFHRHSVGSALPSRACFWCRRSSPLVPYALIVVSAAQLLRAAGTFQS